MTYSTLLAKGMLIKTRSVAVTITNIRKSILFYLVFSQQFISCFGITSIVFLCQQLILFIQPQLNIARLRQVLQTTHTQTDTPE